MNSNIRKHSVQKRRIRNFNKAWLNDDNFKGWLAPHPTENKALCVVCNKAIRCCKTDIRQHSRTVTHITNINGPTQSLGNHNEQVIDKDKIKWAEIKLAAFYAEHNLAFSTIDHLVPIINAICQHLSVQPQIAQNLALKMKRTKCIKIVKEIISKREEEKLVSILQTCKFSILIDESTDITDKKSMCLLVRFVSPVDKKVKTQLLELLALDATDSTASKIFEIFKTFLEKKTFLLKILLAWQAITHQ